MRVGHIVPSLEERHGGPSKSVRALANAQAALGHAVDLLATFEAGHPVAPGNDLAQLHNYPRAEPRWLSRSPELERHLQAAPLEVVHNHALWLRPLHYAHMATRHHGAPLVISPRGMMSGWAYRHRRWRKRLAELFIHRGAFAAAAGWHATSKEEADDIRALGWKQPVCVSPNGVPLPHTTELGAARDFWQSLCPATRSRPVALFYSRFHRKKRLRELIDLWQSAPRGDWLLLIVGVAEDYDAPAVAAMAKKPEHAEGIAVFDGAHRPPPYAAADLFVLPSHSENFGLVIAEALAAGVPALVTDTTPWSGLENAGAGWCVPWEKFDATLAAALATNRAELKNMGRCGRQWMAREFSWERVANLLTGFYQHLLDERR